MPQVSFESLSESLARLPDVIQSIPDIVRNPAANPVQAAILLGIVLVFVLILVVSLVLVLMRPSAEEEALLLQLGEPRRKSNLCPRRSEPSSSGRLPSSAADRRSRSRASSSSSCSPCGSSRE